MDGTKGINGGYSGDEGIVEGGDNGKTVDNSCPGKVTPSTFEGV